MSLFDKLAAEMFKDDKPVPIRSPKFSLGDPIQGTTDEGLHIVGTVSMIGETTYRVWSKSSERSYTIPMDQAQYPPAEEKTSNG